MSRLGPKSLFRELRRRRVFNTIAFYIVGAWVVLQVTELALPALNIPDRAIRYVWLVSLALFPLVLLFGWRYDISTGGIRKTAPAAMAPDTDVSLTAGDRWYIGGLASLSLALIGTALLRIAQTEPEDPLLTTAVDLSVAILPFEVCEGHPDDGPLGGALSEEVRYRLAERSTLKVILRNSTEQLAGFELPRAVIARRLNVQYLVSGAVCRTDGILDVVTRLSDRDNTIVDQRRYEQGINDFDQIVSPLATQVADGVTAALGVGLDRVTETPVNRVAHEQFLISREHARTRDWEGALAAVGQALKLEPDFADGIAWKSLYSVRQAHQSPAAANSEETLHIGEKALAAVNRLIGYDANNAQLQFVAGLINQELGRWYAMPILRPEVGQGATERSEKGQRSHQHYARAEGYFRAARALNPGLTGPGDLNIYSDLAGTLMRQGPDRHTEALEVYEDGFAVDPWNQWLSTSLAQARAEHGRYREAVELLDRYRQLPEVPGRIWQTRREIVLSNGYYDEDCETQLWIRENEPEKLAPGLETRNGYVDFFVRVLPVLGITQEAGDFYERIGDIEKLPLRVADHGLEFLGRGNEVWAKSVTGLVDDLSDGEILQRGWTYGAALALAQTGDELRATGLLEALWASQGTRTGWWSKQPAYEAAGIPILLVELRFGTGRPGDAQPVLEDLQRHLEAEHHIGNRHPLTLRYLAEVYAYLGRDDEALSMLKKAVDYHLRVRDLDSENRLDSPWARLRDDPRFTTQQNHMQTDLEQQAKTVSAMLSRHDMDELLAPLMSAGADGDP